MEGHQVDVSAAARDHMGKKRQFVIRSLRRGQRTCLPTDARSVSPASILTLTSNQSKSK